MSGEVERGPGVSEAAHRQYLEARATHQAATAKEEAKDRADAEAAGTTVRAMRLARAEARARKVAELEAADLDAARRSLGLDELPAGVSPERLDRYARKAVDLREPDGTWPTEEAVAEALSITDRAIRQVGWERVLARAKQLASESGSGGTSG